MNKSGSAAHHCELVAALLAKGQRTRNETHIDVQLQGYSTFHKQEVGILIFYTAGYLGGNALVFKAEV